VQADGGSCRQGSQREQHAELRVVHTYLLLAALLSAPRLVPWVSLTRMSGSS
jgi:hypothetical protein